MCVVFYVCVVFCMYVVCVWCMCVLCLCGVRVVLVCVVCVVCIVCMLHVSVCVCVHVFSPGPTHTPTVGVCFKTGGESLSAHHPLL